MPNIDDYRWLCSPDAMNTWRAVLERPSASADALLRWLRGSLDAQRSAIVMQQWELLEVAKRKFSDPECWFWTKVLLEQASDQETAFETARDFESGSIVYDICAGAGADSVAIAQHGCDVKAYDICPIACELVGHNLKSHQCVSQVCEQAAEQIKVAKNAWVHIDPDRRPNGRRTLHLESMCPSLPTIKLLLEHSSGMSLKLAPGFRPESSTGDAMDRALPAAQAKRFLSKQGVVRQQRWYWGGNRWPTHTVVLSVMLNDPSRVRADSFRESDDRSPIDSHYRIENGWFHEWFSEATVNRFEIANEVIATELGEYIGDYDPVIRAAQLAPAFAQRYGLELLDAESGYLTASTPSLHPLVRWFRVQGHLPLDRRKLKAAVGKMNVREWELKSRGIDLDLALMRKQLPVDRDSPHRATIIFTKLGKQHRAIICRSE